MAASRRPDPLDQCLSKMLMDDGATSSTHLRLSSVPTLSDVVQHRETEPQDVGERPCSGRKGPRRRSLQNVVDATRQQRVLVVEMCIERRAPDVGPFEDLVNNDGVIALFVNERDERVAKPAPRFAHSGVHHGRWFHVSSWCAVKTNTHTVLFGNAWSPRYVLRDRRFQSTLRMESVMEKQSRATNARISDRLGCPL
jgi:hypothetical protein